MFALYLSFVQLLPCVSLYVSIRLCVAVYVQERREVVCVCGGGGTAFHGSGQEFQRSVRWIL